MKPLQPGVTGNPSGRPSRHLQIRHAGKVYHTLENYIKAISHEGKDLINVMMAIAMGKRVGNKVVENVKPGHQVQAVEWLTNRGFGRMPYEHEVSGANKGPIQLQSPLSHHSVETLREILEELEAKKEPNSNRLTSSGDKPQIIEARIVGETPAE